MRKFTETRTISMMAIRNMCIRNQWYTCGTCEEYDRMLVGASNIENVTTEDLAKIAQDIIDHSSAEHIDGRDITDIMWGLASACCIHIE